MADAQYYSAAGGLIPLKWTAPEVCDSLASGPYLLHLLLGVGVQGGNACPGGCMAKCVRVCVWPSVCRWVCGQVCAGGCVAKCVRVGVWPSVCGCVCDQVCAGGCVTKCVRVGV